MPRLMICRDLLLFFRQQQRLALCAHQDFILGQLKVVHQDGLAVVARGQESCLVHHVGEVRATEAGCAPGQNGKIYIVVKRNLASMHAQDFFAAAHVGTVYHHAAIEASGAQQRRIEHIGTVGGRN